jgi:predicted 3-demethylubiquinone-9 3-methyltransferase (glyoxalase superfamily)
MEGWKAQRIGAVTFDRSKAHDRRNHQESPHSTGPARLTFDRSKAMTKETPTQKPRSRGLSSPDVPVEGVAPCLWFDDQAEEAAKFYTATFPDSSITAVSRYPDTFDNPGDKPRGSVMTVELELAGTPFTALNGGPHFTINPTISFFWHARSVEETEGIAAALADGGSYLMELGEYPWSARYAWVQDRFGVSWQVMTAEEAREGAVVVPCLMFTGDVHGRAEEALRLYVDAFPGGTIEALERYTAEEGPEGTIKHGRASLGSQRLVTMDSHLEHGARFSEAVSLQVLCRDQDEVDYFWAKLSDGGEEGPCGWLKDRFGVSWQVVPTSFIEMVKSGEAGGPGYERAFQAMLAMKKLDIAALEAAFEGAT